MFFEGLLPYNFSDTYINWC